jgi:hypothetical protein
VGFVLARVAVIGLVAVLAAAVVWPAGAGATRASSLASPVAKAQSKRMKAVVREWSARLNANDNSGIARLFKVPATLIQGVYVYRLVTRDQIAKWNSLLPCSGRIISIALQGNFATAVFRLGNRGSTPCDAPGSLAAARFEIVAGKIVSWEQVPVPAKKKVSTPVA